MPQLGDMHPPDLQQRVQVLALSCGWSWQGYLPLAPCPHTSDACGCPAAKILREHRASCAACGRS